MDNEFLGKVLEALAICLDKPEFRIEFIVSDPEAAKNELLAKAIDDSKRKAEIMAAAAGITLGKIMSIDYSWGEVELYSRCMDIGEACLEPSQPKAMMNIDVEPDDIDMEDTVTVVWAIE